jgi:hypothetical protein
MTWTLHHDTGLADAAAPGYPGPGTPRAIGTSGYADWLSYVWSIIGGKLRSGGDGGNALTYWATRAAGGVSQRIVAIVPAIDAARNYPVLLRADPAAQKSYQFTTQNDFETASIKFQSGPSTTGGVATGSFAPTAGNNYAIRFTAVPNVTAGTDLTAEFFNLGTSGTLATLTASTSEIVNAWDGQPATPVLTIAGTDNTAGIQTANEIGVAQDYDQISYSRLATYRGTR